MKNTFLKTTFLKKTASITLLWAMLSFCFGVENSVAQDFCGTKSPDPEAKRLFVEQLEKVAAKAKNARIGQTTGVIEWVAVKPWIIQKIENNLTYKAIEEADVNKLIAIVNKDYLASDIQFFIREFGYITDSQYWDICELSLRNATLLNESTTNTHSDNAINIYFSNGIRNYNDSGFFCEDVGTTLGIAPNSIGLLFLKQFPSNGNNIFNNKLYNAVYATGDILSKGYEKTISHELGHYFGLFHTHHDNTTSCIERTESSSQYGDMIADTPVDPRTMWIKKDDENDIYSLTGTINCTNTYIVNKVLNNQVLDSKLQLSSNNGFYLVLNRNGQGSCPTLISSLNPPFNNIMSYWANQTKSCEDIFTPGQINRIQQGKYYRTSYAGVTAYNIFSTPLLSAIPTLTLTNFSTYKQITWNAVANSTGYIIERSTSQTGPFVPIGGIGSNVLICTDYLSNTSYSTYYYRVRCSNSTNYSAVISTASCTPTNEQVTFYNNSLTVNQKSSWYKLYQTKATKWNIIDKNKTGSMTVGEAAKSIILASKSIWSLKYATLQKPCADQNEYAAYVQEMKNLGVLSSMATANDPVDLDMISDMVFKVILDAGAGQNEYLVLPQKFRGTMSRFSGSVKATKLANVITVRFAGINSNTGKPIPTLEYLIDRKTVVTRSLFLKILTGVFETKYFIVNNNTLKQGRVNAELAINADAAVDDIAILGNKPEFEDNVPDSTPTLQVDANSEIIQSGERWGFQVNQGTFGINPVCYWTVEGALQGALLEAVSGSPNFQKVFFTAPTVSVETIVNMVVYCVSEDGQATEIYKQFTVKPAPTNCITLITPSLSYNRIVNASADTKTCNIQNASGSTANLSFSIIGSGAINFYITPTSTTLGSNVQTGLQVTCTASNAGNYTANLQISQTGLTGCPAKINVPLSALVVAAPTEPGLTWVEPIGGTIFYSGSNLPANSNRVSVNNTHTGTEFRYQVYGGNLTTINSCSINPVINPIFPDGLFSKNVKLWARKKDCGTNLPTGNWVLSPSFSIIPVPNPNINVISPNGEEILTGGQVYQIQWSGSSPSPVTLQYSTDGGVTFPNTIATNLSASTGKYTWVVPSLQNFNYTIRIKIISGIFSDISDGNFTIKPPMYLNTTIQQNCDDKGQILIVASGGIGPLTYLVTPGNYTTNDIRGLNAGTYTIKVMDATGESLQTTVTVPTYIPRDFTYTKTDAICGGKNGNIKITGFSNGFIPTRFSYYKNGNYIGVFDTEIINLDAGRYGVYIYQEVGGFRCSVYKIIDINPDNNFNVTSVVTDASCGQTNGAITLTPSSLATYLWANGSTTNSVNNLQQGTQFVTVRNTATGCNLPLSFDVGQKPTISVSSAGTFNNVISDQMAVIDNAILFIKPNSYSILKYNASDFSFQQEFDFTNDFSYYYPNYKLKEIHKRYGAESIIGGLYNPTLGLILNSSGTYNYLTTSFNTSNNVLNSNRTTFTNTSNRPFVYTGASSNSLLSLNNNNTINHIYSSSYITGCYNHLQTTSDGYGTTLAYAIQSCSNKVDELIFDTQFRVYRTYTTLGTPMRAYSNYTFPTCFVTVANSVFQLEVYKSDNTLNYIVPIPTQLSISTDLTNEFTGDSEYLLLSNTAGKVAIFSKTRKSFIDVVDIGMSINKVGYDDFTKRFFFLNGTTLKYITITEPNLSVTQTKADISCSQNGSISLAVSGGGTPTYSWSNGATTKDISNLAVGTYTVTVTPSDGSCALYKSIKIENGVVLPTATVTVSSTLTSFCVGENIQLVANTGNNLTYQWQKDGVDIIGATQQTYYATLGGAYRVKVKNSITGCEATSAATTLTQKTLPTATITPLSSTTICQGSSVTLRSNAATNQTYIWIKDGSVIQGQITMDLSANATGSYQVVNTLNGCSNISNAMAVVSSPLGTATLSGTQTINAGQSATISVALTGISPWSVVVNGVTYTATVSPYTFSVTPSATTTYAISSVSNSCGAGTFSGSAVVTVNACTQMYTTKTGNWNDVTVWSCNRIPTSTDVITIKQNNFITIPASYTANAKNVSYETGGKIIEGANSKLCLSCPDIVLTNGIIAYYPFSGNANDASGNGNNGTNNGAVLTTDRKGVTNSAYTFNGTNSWINTPLVQSNLSGYTVSAWVKADFTVNKEYVILQNRGVTPGSGKSLTLHYQYSTGRWCFAVDGDGVYNGKQSPYTNNTNWVHVVGTWSSGGATSFGASQFNVYVDGVLLATNNIVGAASPIPNTPSGTCAIGRHEAWNNYFKGSMDDIRVYNRALTGAEVLTIYNAEK